MDDEELTGRLAGHAYSSSLRSMGDEFVAAPGLCLEDEKEKTRREGDLKPSQPHENTRDDAA